jgi:hypothetical protein
MEFTALFLAILITMLVAWCGARTLADPVVYEMLRPGR